MNKEPWRVHAIDESSLVLRSPGGTTFIAECPNGRLDLEAEDVFFPMRHTGLVAGSLHNTGFRFDFPPQVRGFPSIHGGCLWGFRIITPRAYTLDLIFVREKPPASLARVLTALTERKEAESDEPGQLQHQPVPAHGGHPATEGQGGEHPEEHEGGARLEREADGEPVEARGPGREGRHPERREVLRRRLFTKTKK